jgi:hypothetical protein
VQGAVLLEGGRGTRGWSGHADTVVPRSGYRLLLCGLTLAARRPRGVPPHCAVGAVSDRLHDNEVAEEPRVLTLGRQ